MKTHRFDPISFISGMVIALLGLAFLVPQTPVDVVDLLTDLGGWFWPALLVAVGIVVMLPAFLRRDEAETIEPAGDSNPPDEQDESLAH